MENESGQHLGDELLGADEDDVVERVPDSHEEIAVPQPQAQKTKTSAKEGDLAGCNMDHGDLILVSLNFLNYT
jgi:hypothetical protein